MYRDGRPSRGLGVLSAGCRTRLGVSAPRPRRHHVDLDEKSRLRWQPGQKAISPVTFRLSGSGVR
jgi:hypothetical protein